MTKTERLFHIVNYLRIKKEATIEDLARECMVSSRTTYRDVNDLVALEVATYDDNICRLARVETNPHWEMTSEELDITQFALHSSPIADQFYFQGKIKTIDNKLRKELERISEKRGVDPQFLLHAPAPSTHIQKKASADSDTEDLVQFWRYLNNNRQLKIIIKKPGRGQAREMIVRATRLIWTSGKWWYEAINQVDGKTVRLDASRVEKVLPLRRTNLN